MRALVLKEPLSIAAGECPDLNSEPRPGCALIRVRSIGVCGSDLHAFRGHHPFVTYPRVLGHELGCEVLAIGANDRGISVGDHVCVEPLLTCGKCYPCRQGRYNCCVNIKVLGIHTDGGMTERIEVPVERLHKPKIDLSYDELALCETLSIGVQAVKRGGVVSGQNVVVVGAGPIGLGAMIAARAKGAKVLVIDPIELNRKTALEMGADAVVDPSHEDVVKRIQQWSPDDGGAHVVLEAVGLPATIAQAVQFAAPTGTVVVIGISKEIVPLTFSDWMRKEVALLTTRNSCDAFPAVLALFENYRSELARMVTHHFSLDEGPKVFNWLHESRGRAGVIKAVLHQD